MPLPPSISASFVPFTRILLAKVVYMVLGSSYLPSSQLGRSWYWEDPSAKQKYNLLHVQETYVITVILHNTPCLPPNTFHKHYLQFS